jgi:hypothetical protein
MPASTIKNMAVAMVLAVATHAEIVDNAFWQGHDNSWSQQKIKIADGIPGGTDVSTNQYIQSSWAAVGHPKDYLLSDNVVRIRLILTEGKFNDFFPEADRDCHYTYNSFLRAAAKYPAFCNEETGSNTIEDTCAKELAALFAFMDYKNEGLKITEAGDCAGDSDIACGRGPMMISGDDYPEFSASFFEGYDRSEKFQENPGLVGDDGYFGFASAIWKYMHIESPGPSAHSVITGNFVPNAGDLQAGHNGGFGTAILVLSKDDCGGWTQKPGATELANKYNDNLVMLGR